MKYSKIRILVRKTDGRLPTIQSIAEAAATYKDVKSQRGRPKGARKTTKLEDKKTMKRIGIEVLTMKCFYWHK